MTNTSTTIRDQERGLGQGSTTKNHANAMKPKHCRAGKYKGWSNIIADVRVEGPGKAAQHLMAVLCPNHCVPIFTSPPSPEHTLYRMRGSNQISVPTGRECLGEEQTTLSHRPTNSLGLQYCALRGKGGGGGG
jgi:hypothetical protein